MLASDKSAKPEKERSEVNAQLMGHNPPEGAKLAVSSSASGLEKKDSSKQQEGEKDKQDKAVLKGKDKEETKGKEEKSKEIEISEADEARLDSEYEHYYPSSLAPAVQRMIAPDARSHERASSGIFRQAGYFTESHFSVFTSHQQPHREEMHVAQFPASASIVRFKESISQKPEFSKSKFGVFAPDFNWEVPKVGVITGKNGHGKTALLDYLFGHFMAYKWQVFRFDAEFLDSIDRNVRTLGHSPLYGLGLVSNFEQHFKDEVDYINDKLNILDAGFTVTVSPTKKSLLVEDHARVRHIHELSTGQKVLLSLISWMYVLKVNLKSGKMSHINGVAFLLDEVDVHFHPEFINGFIEFINEYVEGIGKECHLVMTTHNPATIALAGDDAAIYIMGKDKSGKTTLELTKSKRHAITALSSGLLTVTEDVNYVLVENEPDAKFYSMVYFKFLQSRLLLQPRTQLVFTPVGIKKFEQADLVKLAQIISSNPKMDNYEEAQALAVKLKDSNDVGGGCTQIEKRTKVEQYEMKANELGVIPDSPRLQKDNPHTPEIIWGLLDRDDPARKGKGKKEKKIEKKKEDNETSKPKSNKYIIDVYSFENYLCMPLNLFYLIKMDADYHHNPLPEFDSLFYNVSELLRNNEHSEEQFKNLLQAMSDKAIHFLKCKINERVKEIQEKANKVNDIDETVKTLKSNIKGKADIMLGSSSQQLIKKPFKKRQKEKEKEKTKEEIILLEALTQLNSLDLFQQKLDSSDKRHLSLAGGAVIECPDLFFEGLGGKNKNSGGQRGHKFIDVIELIMFGESRAKQKYAYRNIFGALEEIPAALLPKTLLTIMDGLSRSLPSEDKEAAQMKSAPDDLLLSVYKDSDLQSGTKSKKDVKDNEDVNALEDTKNAFNQFYNNKYWYKEDDITYIGKMLFQNINYIRFIGAFGAKNTGIATPIQEGLLHSRLPVIGIFNTGGDHWIAFMLKYNSIRSQYILFQKDSRSHRRKGLETFLSSIGINLDDKNCNLNFHEGREQIEMELHPEDPFLYHCGLFALKNAVMLARLTNKQLGNYKAVSFFSPPRHVYDETLANLRKVYSAKYVQGHSVYGTGLSLNPELISSYRGNAGLNGYNMKDIVEANKFISQVLFFRNKNLSSIAISFFLVCAPIFCLEHVLLGQVVYTTTIIASGAILSCFKPKLQDGLIDTFSAISSKLMAPHVSIPLIVSASLFCLKQLSIAQAACTTIVASNIISHSKAYLPEAVVDVLSIPSKIPHVIEEWVGKVRNKYNIEHPFLR